uniref:NADH-ubiquinone oxidoreductase chain 6 n=1 Tax=Luprops yunnanus TaxID=2984368 RepID=A0A978AZW3_9CUCU|nr:NADH dehydrogenase subunit 6 [Luprops yunnanus]UYB79053.1 NADH dehydrogenase subunit 6 [Luprops yunnanus]
MMIMMSINIILSTIFVFMKHPLSMGIILMIQTTIISLMTGLMNSSFWFSYIIFLIMIGGMLILFMYMTSVASNEMFELDLKPLLALPFIALMMMYLKSNIEISLISSNSYQINSLVNYQDSFSKFISMPNTMTLTFMMIYLLIALIAVVKMTHFSKGPLRQMN